MFEFYFLWKCWFRKFVRLRQKESFNRYWKHRECIEITSIPHIRVIVVLGVQMWGIIETFMLHVSLCTALYCNDVGCRKFQFFASMASVIDFSWKWVTLCTTEVSTKMGILNDDTFQTEKLPTIAYHSSYVAYNRTLLLKNFILVAAVHVFISLKFYGMKRTFNCA